jgi:molybdopterin-guanine dinucleotide biosynthesis protein
LLGDGVAVNILEIGIRIHFVRHDHHTHVLTSGTNKTAFRALVEDALVAHSGTSTNGVETPRTREGRGAFIG